MALNELKLHLILLKMNRIAGTGHLSGVSRIFALSSAQGRLTHEQRLSLKEDGRPCPRINIKNRDSETAYNNFSWMCGDAQKNTYFCWPCLVMGDLSKVRTDILDFNTSCINYKQKQQWTTVFVL